MVKTVRFHQFGGPEVLQVENLPVPRPDHGEVLLRLHAVAVTYSDTRLYWGTSMMRPALPSGIGSEGAGTVEAVGPEVDSDWLGKRVSTLPTVALRHYWLLAEQAIAPVSALAEAPDGFSDAECCGLWSPYLGAYASFVEGVHLSKGDHVPIIFPCAGCRLAAIQLAKAESATVIAVTDNPPLKQTIAAAGADCVIVNKGEDLMSRVERFLEGRRLRAILSESGDPILEQLHRLICSGGTIVEAGNQPSMHSRQTTLPAEITFLHCQPEAITENAGKLAEAVAYICERLRFGYFSVDVERKSEFPHVVDAYRYMESNAVVGNVVVIFPDRRLPFHMEGGK